MNVRTGRVDPPARPDIPTGGILCHPAITFVRCRMSASQLTECRICHKKGDLGITAILLTCGLCKRHSHHCESRIMAGCIGHQRAHCVYSKIACLVPPIPEAHLLLLLRATMGRTGPAFGDPRIWLCPRCTTRNPEAAKQTVIGKANPATVVPIEVKKTPTPAPSRLASVRPESQPRGLSPVLQT